MHVSRIAMAAIAALAAPCAAHAVSLLQIDVNSLTATAAPGFGLAYTGAITLQHDGDSSLNGVRIDGVSQTIGAGFVLSSVAGTIQTVGGAVTGGSLSISVTNGVSTDTYTASLVDGSGSIKTQAGQGFMVDGLSFDGFFSGATFAGIDLSKWDAAEPLLGSFLNFAFRPNAQGVDTDSDLEVYVAIPLPGSAALALAGVAGLCVRRRRL